MRQPLLRLILGTTFAMSSLPLYAADDVPVVIPHFEITRFEVEGNTLLTPYAVEKVLQPFTGRDRSFSHVQMALEALEGAYRRRGYNVVQVTLPEQELNQGVVRLQVTETRIGQVRVEGNQVFDEANIRRSLPGLREGQAPDIGQISSSLRLANENPAKKVALQLQSANRDDEIDAVLNVSDERPWKLAATLDNTGNQSTGKTHLSMQFQHANIADADQVLSLQYTTTLEKPSQVSVYGAGYHIPLYALGDSIDLFANYSDVDSGSVLTGLFNLQVSGRGTMLGGRYNYNLRRSGDYDSKLIAGLDYKAFQNNVSLQGLPLGNAVTVHPLSLAYAGTLGMAEGEASFSIAASHNVPGGSRGGSADFNFARAGASPHYSILRYGAAYANTLPRDWQMRVAVSGQYSHDALIPGEQFGAGGASSVRGFQEREIANDTGYLFNTELYTPNVCSRMQTFAVQCRFLAFYDAAHVSSNNALPGELAQASIGSVGIGLRAGVNKNLTLQMDYGQVIDAGVTQKKGDKRLHFRLDVSY